MPEGSDGAPHGKASTEDHPPDHHHLAAGGVGDGTHPERPQMRGAAAAVFAPADCPAAEYAATGGGLPGGGAARAEEGVKQLLLAFRPQFQNI